MPHVPVMNYFDLINTHVHEHCTKCACSKANEQKPDLKNSNLRGILKGHLSDETMIKYENFSPPKCNQIESSIVLSVMIMIQETLLIQSQINVWTQLSTMIELFNGGFIINIFYNGIDRIGICFNEKQNESSSLLFMSIILFVLIDTMIEFCIIVMILLKFNCSPPETSSQSINYIILVNITIDTQIKIQIIATNICKAHWNFIYNHENRSSNTIHLFQMANFLLKACCNTHCSSNIKYNFAILQLTLLTQQQLNHKQ